VAAKKIASKNRTRDAPQTYRGNQGRLLFSGPSTTRPVVRLGVAARESYLNNFVNEPEEKTRPALGTFAGPSSGSTVGGNAVTLTAVSVLLRDRGRLADPGVNYGGLTGSRKQGKPEPARPCSDVVRVRFEARRSSISCSSGSDLGGRIRGSHRLEGGGDRVRLSEQLERGAIEAGLVDPWKRTNAMRFRSAQRLPTLTSLPCSNTARRSVG
jgi:hypothetical protein